jgi:P pilus assembly chaperone PapD
LYYYLIVRLLPPKVKKKKKKKKNHCDFLIEAVCVFTRPTAFRFHPTDALLTGSDACGCIA